MKEKVVVALSGGVDSSVAAALALEAGCEVVGATLRLKHPDPAFSGAQLCASEQDEAAIAQVVRTLGIEHRFLEGFDRFRSCVLEPSAREYMAGRTPNPDVLCNREIKFGPFKDYAMALGADFIATGHYCGIRHENGMHYLLKATDEGKDQTYFLNQVTQAQFENVLFPLGGICKPQVREIAEKYGLSTAAKKDSTGICFIGERNFRNFLRNYLPAKPGKMMTCEGEVVGEHMGLMYYTLGQRKGLDLGGRKGDEGGRWFVVEKDLKNNILYVSHGDESRLYTDKCTVSGINWIPSVPAAEFVCTAKFRYRQKEQGVRVCRTGETDAEVYFDVPQRAVTPGQYAVFYEGDRCIGGGVIEKPERLS